MHVAVAVHVAEARRERLVVLAQGLERAPGHDLDDLGHAVEVDGRLGRRARCPRGLGLALLFLLGCFPRAILLDLGLERGYFGLCGGQGLSIGH